MWGALFDFTRGLKVANMPKMTGVEETRARWKAVGLAFRMPPNSTGQLTGEKNDSEKISQGGDFSHARRFPFYQALQFYLGSDQAKRGRAGKLVAYPFQRHQTQPASLSDKNTGERWATKK